MNKSAKCSHLSRMFQKLVLLMAALIALGSVNAGAVGSGTLDQASGWYPLGTNLTVHASPANNSTFTGWLGNTNGSTIVGNQITFAVNSSLSVTGLFSTAQFALTVASPQGTPTPAGNTTNAYGTLINAYVQSPVVNGTTQYVATGWTGSGSVGSGTGTNVSINITNATSLTWLWQTNYLLTASAGANGSITPSGALYVAQGSNQTYSITANGNNRIASVTVDGTNAGTMGSFTFTNVMAPHTISATFVTNQFTLTVSSVQGAPSPGGITTNASYALINAYIQSPVVNGTTQYVATGWTGSGSVGSGAGTNVSFNITNNTVLTWQWQTNVWVNLNVLGN